MNQPRARALLRNVSLLGAGTAGSAVLQYALWFVVARWLQPQAYGTFSLALTIALLSAPFQDLGNNMSLLRTCSRHPERLPETLGAALAWRLVLLPIVAALAFGVCAVAGYGGEVALLLAPLLAATFCDSFGTLCAATFQARERMGAAALVAVGRVLARALALVLVMLAGGGALALAIAWCAAAAAAAAPAWIAVRRSTAIAWSRAAMRPALREATPFGLANVASMLHAQVDVAVLAAVAGVGEVASYHAGMRFYFLAVLVPQTLGMAAAPTSFRLGLQGPAAVSRLYRANATILAAIGVAAALVLAVHGELLARCALGGSYFGAGPIVIAAAPAVLLKFLSAPLATFVSSVGRQRYLTAAWWLALTVNFAANLVLAPRLGALGAALATVASETVQLATLTAIAVAAGGRLGWRAVLARPLVTAALVALSLLASGALGAATPGGMAVAAACVAGGLAVHAALVWCRPTTEEAVLLRALRPASR